MNALYIPGLGSTGETKCKTLSSVFDDVICANYPPELESAVEFLDELIASHQSEDLIIVGSSLGGFLSNHFSEKYNLPCILINPLVDPDDLKQFIGNSTITERDINVLQELELSHISRNNKLVLLCKDDEIFDFNKAYYKYENQANVVVENVGGHAYANLSGVMKYVVEFKNQI